MAQAGSQPFNPRAVLALVIFGGLVFLAMLYLIGAGETDSGSNDGGAHAYGKGLNGYAALARTLEESGMDVEMARNEGAYTSEDLLILTPPNYMDAERLTEIIEGRRYLGPTIVIMPKWFALPARPSKDVEVKPGWVRLSRPAAPLWSENLEGFFEMEVEVTELADNATHWRGLGFSGALPEPDSAMALNAPSIATMVADTNGRTLAGYIQDGGYYYELASAIGEDPGDYEQLDTGRWALMIIAEPDLVNNYGLADADRARLALALVELAREGENLPVTFDLTLNGLGKTQNLLTLAFTPPFLAATLCLILALIVVGWRAFRRFGPPVAEDRAIAFGKRQLVTNSAGFVQRTGRLHLLTAPYAELVAGRLAKLLGVRGTDPETIDAALARRLPDAPSFSERAEALRKARRPSEILREAHALKSIERMLHR